MACSCFVASLACYMVAFSRIGWVYYRDSKSRWVPMVAIVVGL